MTNRLDSALRRPRTSQVAAVAVALVAAAYFLWPESVDAKVVRLVEEMQGAPRIRFGWTRPARSNHEILEELDRLGETAVPPLIAVLNGRSPAISRSIAAMQLGKIGDRRAAPALVQALADSAPGLDVAAAAALGEIGDRSAVEALIRCLASEKSNLRASAAVALGQIGDRRAFDSLASRVADPELTVRAYAVEALGKLGDPRALRPLAAALRRDGSPWVRELAIYALVRLETAESIPALQAACFDESPGVRGDAKSALSLLGQAYELTSSSGPSGLEAMHAATLSAVD
jgi:HEAT repeat protein